MSSEGGLTVSEWEIAEDFEEIKEHLGLPDDLGLEIELDHNEGFYFSNRPSVMIGIKGGYNRRLLVHECLHADGMTHYSPPSYESVINRDGFSARVEKEIFEVG